MGHLQAGPPEPTLDIETFICLAAIQDALVTTHFLGDKIQGLDYLEAQLLPLLVLGDSDIFDVAYYAQIVDTRTDDSQ